MLSRSAHSTFWCSFREGRPAAAGDGGAQQRDLGGLDHGPVRQHDRPLDGVLQLAHVAGPVVALQRAPARRPRRPPPRRPVRGAVLAQEVLDQERDVLAPVAQGRDLDGDDAQAVVEVLLERALRRPSAAGRGWWRRSPARPPSACARRPAARTPAPGARAAAWPARRALRVPISSRKMVPPSARANLPFLLEVAPVKAPRTWPNSSDSSRVSGMAAQLTLMSGMSALGAAVVDGRGPPAPCPCPSRP